MQYYKINAINQMLNNLQKSHGPFCNNTGCYGNSQ